MLRDLQHPSDVSREKHLQTVAPRLQHGAAFREQTRGKITK